MFQKKIRFGLLGTFIMFLALFENVFGQDSPFQFNGFLDTYQALQTQWPRDILSSRTRLRTEMRVSYENAYLFASLNAVHNNVVKDQSGISLQEAYFNYEISKFEFKAGRQIIVWGVADGLRVTDLISPMDYTEFMTKDYDDMRMAVDGFRLKYSGNWYSGELVYVPVPSYFSMPTENENPWRPDVPENVKFNFKENPEPKLRNGEVGSRLNFFTSIMDFSLSVLHTYNKSPISVLHYDTTSDSLVAEGIHRSMNMLGGDASIPIGEFVIRLEVAGYFDEVLAVETNDFVQKNTFNGLVGLDWFGPNGWTVMLQYMHKYIADYNSNLSLEKNTSTLTFRISKDLLNNTLKTSLYGYWDVDNLAYYGRVSGEYAFSDQVSLSVGYDHFGGKRGQLAYYKKNREVWCKAKYYF